MKYRKKPVIIEAFRMGIDDMPDWFMNNVTDRIITLQSGAPKDCHIEQRGDYKTWCEINTLEGTMISSHGDYIIKGVQGETYACKPDIFKATYEEVGE